MAQAGYTPIQLYFSTTAAAVPVNTNLVNGELALNIQDEKLYFKNAAGTVKLLAGATSGPAGGSNTQVQFNSSGALAGSSNMTFNGTTLTVNDLTDSSLTAGRVTYAGTAGNLIDSANLTFDGTNLGVGLTPTGQSRVHVYTGNNAVNGVQTQFNASNFPIALASSTSSGFPYLGVNTVQKVSSNTQTYAITGFASRIHASGGGFTFSTAASGTAGADITFTDAMTLTAAGSLVVGGTEVVTNNGGITATTTSSGSVQATLAMRNAGTGNGSGSTLAFRGVTNAGAENDYAYLSMVADNTTALTGSIRFSTASGAGAPAERVRISSAGNVGIGTNSPGQKLSVATTDGTSCYIEAQSTGFTSVLYGQNNAGDAYVYNSYAGNIRLFTSATERARISAAGGFSVGTTSDPGAGAIYATGNITAFFSDKRLKTVSGKIENALDKVGKLSGVYYTFNDTAKSFGYDSDEVQVGVIAQEVEAVLPQIVKAAPFDLDENNNSKSGENYKTVQYDKLVPLLIEAINELRAEVKALKGE